MQRQWGQHAPPPSDGVPQSTWLLVLVIAVLTGALQFQNGSYDPAAIGWLAAACLITTWIVFQTPAKPWLLLAGLLVVAFIQMGPLAWNRELYQQTSPAYLGSWMWVPITTIPLLWIGVSGNRQRLPLAGMLAIIGGDWVILSYTHFNFFTQISPALYGEKWWIMPASGYLAILSAGMLWKTLSVRQLSFIILWITMCCLGLWIIHLISHPPIDTWPWGQKGAAALLHGHNPYAITIRDIYPPGSPYYAPGVVQHGRVMVGYVYPPLSLLTDTAGYLAGGDFRYAELAMFMVSSMLLAIVTDFSRAGLLGATVLLLVPQAFFVVAMGWIEPCVLLMFMVLIVLARWKPGWMGVGFALFLVSKQYVFLAAPLVIILWPRPIRRDFIIRFCIQAAITGCAINLPFLLWNPHAFFNSVVPRHIFRLDSLSLASYWAHQTGHWPPAWLWWGTVGLVNGICLWRLPRRPWAFAFGTACVYLTFFVGASEAFDNYYFLILCLFCIALALRLHEQYPATQETPPLRQQPAELPG